MYTVFHISILKPNKNYVIFDVVDVGCRLIVVVLIRRFIVQGSIFTVTLYDAVYLYLKLASEALKNGGNETDIKNGKFMYEQAKNYHTITRK